IFNSALVLASPETATDDDYERIAGVVAHEYFHNWTGNRVTCRDWFQLTLKEGLTVFRDQRFTAESTSEPVKRIEDVSMLRLRQFPEDAGPMSHPIRPESYIAMDNFYTATVYEKGAEVIRMYASNGTTALRSPATTSGPRWPTPTIAISPSSSAGTPRREPRAWS
ncbi:MAG: M1 family aminopeptidase, partial [Planctomycetota bacterium]